MSDDQEGRKPLTPEMREALGRVGFLGACDWDGCIERRSGQVFMAGYLRPHLKPQRQTLPDYYRGGDGTQKRQPIQLCTDHLTAAEAMRNAAGVVHHDWGGDSA